MSTEQNKALAKRLVEDLINQRDLSAADDIISPAMVEHEEVPPGVPEGAEGTKVLFGMLFEGFPDVQATVEHLIAEEDMVVVHMTWSGTHKGEFMGIPASGKPMSIHVVDIFRVADGKIAEHWGVTDMMGLMQQIGAGPE